MALATSGIVAASLILCTVISVWQAMVARRAEGLAQERLIAETEARQQATDEAAKAIATSSLLQKVLQSADPDKAKGADYTRARTTGRLFRGLGDQLKDPETAQLFTPLSAMHTGDWDCSTRPSRI